MKKITVFYLSIVLLAFVSCSDDNGGSEGDNGSGIANQEVQGIVKGKAFKLAGGNAFRDTFNDRDDVQIYLFNQPGDCEAGSINFLDEDIYDLVISVRAARKVATYDDINIVSHDLSDTDGFGPSNIFQSQLEITEVTETSISGKLRVDSDGGGVLKTNKYEGTFIVPLCEPEF